ncbi:MAG: LysE family translocator [Colwellia sp.]|nr:LysE family translocator [Colwellia sp.]
MTLEYLVAALVIILIPGTGVIYTVGIGLVHKRLSMVYAALGCTLAISPHLLASIFGLSALLNSSAVLFNIVKFLGVIYLLYMAYNLFMDKGVLEFRPNQDKVNNNAIIKNGFLVNALNPKLSIFFLAFIPQFVSKSSESPLLSMFILGLVFMLMTFIVFVIYGYFANLLQYKVIQSRGVIKSMQKFFAVIFAILAYKMANI